jgi:hypothetical protein
MSFKYNYGRELFLTAQINWLADDIRMAVVDNFYSPSVEDQFVSDIPTNAIIRRSDFLQSKSAADGFARAVPAAMFSLSHANPVIGVVFFKDTGDDATSPLLAFVDDGVAFPLTAIGFDYYFAYDSIEGGFFRT